MKIKLDQNLSRHLPKVPAALNHDVDTVFEEGLAGVDDDAVLQAACSQDRILFTLDTDFLNLKPIRQVAIAALLFFACLVRVR
jgi:predicted nuclease of predicted toxin-antitoxin system